MLFKNFRRFDKTSNNIILSYFICTFCSGCISSTYLNEPIFQTTSDSPEAVEGLESYKPYIFMTQYYADVENRLSINITKGENNNFIQAAVAPIITPKSRYYLYVLKNALFQDTIEVKTNANGMLTTATSESKQQITAIVTSIGKALGEAGVFALNESQPDDQCQKAIQELPKNTYLITDTIKYHKDGIRVALHGSNVLKLKVEFPEFKPENIDETKSIRGIIIFFPYQIDVSLFCEERQLTAPQKVNVYMDRHVIYPKRDFLTNEYHNSTIDAGFYLGQTLKTDSAAKTIVDTALAPVQSIVPNVNITNTVTSVPGKADEVKSVTTTSTPK